VASSFIHCFLTLDIRGLKGGWKEDGRRMEGGWKDNGRRMVG